MFSTFSANLNSTDRPSEQPAAAPRPKRNQVVRACDWCRLNRIKCDDKQPCQNCRNHGGYCSNTKQFEAQSLPAANREIHRLRNRLKDLQEQLDKVTEESKAQAAAAKYPSPQSSNASISSLTAPTELPVSARKTWDGIADPESRTGRVIHYGPLSSPYMVLRLNRHLSDSLNQPHVKSPLPVRISQLHRHAPTISQEQLSDDSERPDLRVGLNEVEDLSRDQEEYFLVLLWQAYHCMYPIIAEEEFRTYYDSLWAGTNGQQPRQPSALVDSLLAVCMQYGSMFLVDDDDMADSDSDSQATHFTTAAHAFYRRSQRTLMEKLENPSVHTLQSHMYCIIYLYNTASLDTAHMLLGLAIRIAQMLRLHIRPLEPTPKHTQELHSRIWWTLYQLDSQISMTLGRPPIINPDDVGCPMPGDSGEAVELSATVLVSPPDEDISWLSFHTQYVRLTAAARAVHSAFEARTMQVLQSKNFQDIHEDPLTLESLAGFLGSEVRTLYDWVQGVPRSLKNQRKGSAEPFSTDRKVFNLNPASPLWLQRQRLLLELIYHHLQIATFRPFVRFPPRDRSVTPLADSHSISCLNHAVVLTMLLHQVLSETDLLRGWTPIFQYQWDATICIMSFVLANPVCPPTPAARKILPTALRTLEKLDPSFATAASAAQMVWEQFRSSSTPRGWSSLTPPSQGPPEVNQPPSTGMPSNGMTTTAPGAGPVVVGSNMSPTDPFSGLLTPTKMPPSMMMGNNFPDPNITPQLDLMDPSLNLPHDLLMGTGTQWMSNGAMVLDSWLGYGSE
ncbi:hypothetical protein ASPWEDRAFT_106212 [Aspergillus wentii DTO 134E9]|uniref:Zn(2)-C6 fungal-type domain-containing protein n=1 Tax=Aspergillus wentii DTO 134E9 TaxID=1073089 RepID=A0A1L9RV05_ASPWE|nr:uncharacterized protein ASPWEDRAFT_106212 [Aspergillus wentii DTO 134E9]KAI9928671.1 hypothetical protein MW887_001887 [Aspergillus wentii]OJJ38756.1 hypothetical protein ASPWEDRAFT_106212 [Aspergillus wentii DTO 134E9]